MNLRAALATTVAISAIAMPSIAVAQERNFDVPAQTAVTSIPELARQADVQILVSESVVKGKRTKAVRGKMTVRQALGKLLSGTGIRVASGDGRTFTLAGQSSSQPSAEGNEPVAVTRDSTSSSGEETKTAQTDQAGISEILVVGSRSQNVDIRRTEDDPQPYVVFGAEEIGKSGATNLEDFFRTRLPMNTSRSAATQPNDSAQINDNGVGAFINKSEINLRGLGANQTLILIDGRRAPRLDDGSGFSQADINGLPLSAIERIEILPSTAGGIYGGGALGGVINIIRKRNYNGIDLRLGFDGAFRGGSEAFRAEASGGMSLGGGNTQISFAGSYYKLRPLLLRDNDLWKRARARFLATPEVFPPPNGPGTKASFIIGATPRVCAASGFGLFLDCDPSQTLSLGGQDLGVNVSSIPERYAGVSSDGGAALAANAGYVNLDLSPENANYVLRSGSEVLSGNVNIRQHIGASIEAFADVSFSENRGRSSRIPNVSIPLSAGVAGNPFDGPVVINVPLDGIQSGVRSVSQSAGISGGLLARLGAGWSALGEITWARARSKAEGIYFPINLTLLQSDASDGTVNLFRDLRENRIDLTPYQRTAPDTVFGPTETIQKSASFRLSGPLAEIWGGPLTLTGLIEHRLEEAKSYEVRGAYEFIGFSGVVAQYRPSRSQTVDSGYAELIAPLVSSQNAMPFVRALEVQAAIRYDRYKTLAPTPPYADLSTPLPDFTYSSNTVADASYTLAARWEPFDGIALRASYATGFLAPSISQIAQEVPIPFDFSYYTDPKRGGEPLGTNILFATGGNPRLQPETSKSLSLGIVWKPAFVPGFRISADYTRIRKSQEIQGALDINYLLNHEDVFPDRIQRAPGSGTTPGPIIALDNTAINVASKEVKTIDFRVDYTTNLGSFGNLDIYAIATRQNKFKQQILATDIPIDTVGFYDGPLKWRANGGVDWRLGNFSLAWNMQYYDGYKVAYADLGQSMTNVFRIQAQGSATIPSQVYHDLNIRYQFTKAQKGWLSGVDLNFGVQNLFDKRPPVDISSSSGFPPLAGYSSYGDPRLRRFTFTLSKHLGK